MVSDDQNRTIGTLVEVSADKLVVELHRRLDNFTTVGFDDMHYIAQLGSFVLIPVQAEYLVAQVINVREKDLGTAPSFKSDNSNLKKAGSAKYMNLGPLGMLSREEDSFTFGVSTYPSLYSDVLYATKDDLDRVFDVSGAIEQINGGTRYKSLSIGRSTVFKDYETRILIDEFFSGHAAILGNTGSGKSSTVASILQSLFSKTDKLYATGATFILFDVNGEYGKALKSKRLSECIDVLKLKLGDSADKGGFSLPHWILSQEEWELLLMASEKTQRPVLRTALKLTALYQSDEKIFEQIKQHFVAVCIKQIFASSEGAAGQMRRVRMLLEKFGTDKLSNDLLNKYGADDKFGTFPSNKKQQEFLEDLKKFIKHDVELPAYCNNPFEFRILEQCVEFAIMYEEAHGNRQIRDYCSPLLTRLNDLSHRDEFSFLRDDFTDDMPMDFDLREILGLGVNNNNGHLRKKKQIVILDMNSVGDEVVEVVTAVISRLIFECLRKQKKRNQFPVHLVLEEAHRYIGEKPSIYAVDASRVFERIAKEGRKFGMFLLVASQRPSELSKAVLSQCTNFVLHRIQNPDDLMQIRQMTPFISDEILKRLPSLPKQHALIFGNAVNIPSIFKVREADPTTRSDDAKIRELWFKPKNKKVKLTVNVVPNVETEESNSNSNSVHATEDTNSKNDSEVFEWRGEDIDGSETNDDDDIPW